MLLTHAVAPPPVRFRRLALLPTQLGWRACESFHIARVCKTVEVVVQHDYALGRQERHRAKRHTHDVCKPILCKLIAHTLHAATLRQGRVGMVVNK